MWAVLDFWQVNSASVPDRYTIREVRDCVDEISLHGSQVFSTIDLTSGFWQQSLEKSSCPYTVFTVPGKGTRYQGSPASFACLIDYCMREITGVLTYIDDVLVHCSDHPSQLETLETAFLRFRKYGLKLNLVKSAFGAREVTNLGYRLTGEGISPGEAKLKAVSDFQAPLSIKQIREFIGLANYFPFLIPNFAFYAGIMTRLVFEKQIM